MQIKHIYLIKTLHEALSHPPKGWVIQIAVVRDECENAIPSFLNTPLCKANELDIVVVEPFRIALSKRLPIDLKVIAYLPACFTVFTMQQFADPFPFVC